jgi:hypothetical protein
MTVNPYFRRNKQGEQSLLQSLTTEAIKIHGHEMVYIPREKVTEDFILGEEVSEFKDANRIEMYLEGGDYEGEQEMSRFGLDVRESATFIVSTQRFLDVMGHNDEIRKNGRPREGDIIYFDYPFSMFEIKFVEHDNPFYPAGGRYSFRLTCEAFKYSNEKIDTGESEMDGVMEITSSYLVGVTLSAGSNGTYAKGEEVYTGISSNKKAFGAVNRFTVPLAGDKYAYINRQEGKFQVGDILTGAASGATYEIMGVYETSIRVTHKDQEDNDQLEFEKNRDDIFDFTEEDPFSEGTY